MRRRVPYKVIYLLSCFVFLSFGLISTGFAQTSDEVLYGQIQTAQIQEKEEPRFGANDLQANVIIVAGDSVFIDAGRVAGLERSDYLSGQITRRTHSGEEVIGNFAILEVGGEVSQVVVIPVFGKTVQLGDRAVFGTYTAQAQEPNLQNMHVNNEFKNSLGNLFADTDPNAGRAIGLANTGLANAATPEAFQENVAVSTSAGGLISSRAYNASNAQVNKSSVIPTGSAASLLAGAISSAAAQNAATGAPLYCSDPRFADREACQGPVPLMGQSSVSSVTPTTTTMSTANSNSVTATRPASALPATALPTTMTVNANIPVTSSVPVPAYCSSQAYSSRPECTVSPVSTNQTPQASASQPGYCTDSRYATRPECMTSATTTTATVSNAPAYCATPANQSRPECMATSQPASQLASQAHQGSHISTASAAPQNTVAGSALSIDPYTGQPYTTSYQGYSGDEATPLVHTAAQSQARQATQAQAAQQAQSPIQSRSRVVSGVVSSIPYGTGSSSARTVTNVDVPAYIGPATIANQTIAIPVLPNTTPYYAPNTTENTQVTSAPQTSTSYTTVQTYYDSNWGDEWDPSYVNTTPSSTGIIPANAPAPYYLRVARVKNNLGFPNEAINILEMGLAQYPNDVSLNSEMTMIYTMLTQGNMGDFCPEESSIAPDPVTTVSASADMCEEEVVEEYHEHDDHHHDDDHSHDDNHHHSHGDYDHEHGHEHSHEHDADYGSSGSSQYANDHLENVQITTRYNAPTRDARQQNSRQQSAGQNGPYRLENEEDMVNQSYAAQVQNRGATPQMSAASPMANQNMANQNMVNQSYAAQNQNKPAFNSPIGMASGTGMYDSEKGGIVRPRWNTDK